MMAKLQYKTFLPTTILKPYFLLLFLLVLAENMAFASPPRVIVIDPGHGGKDPGAMFGGLAEKDITLAVSLLVANKLSQELPDTKVALTRDSDVYNHVTEKAEIANNLNGELFVSIHVNSAKSLQQRSRNVKKNYYVMEHGKKIKKQKTVKQYYKVEVNNSLAEGTEVYIWASDRANNKADATASGIERNVEDDELSGIPDFNSPEGRMLSQMYAQKFFKSSFRLATLLDTEFKKVGRVSRGVQQRNNKGIWVLQATGMPAVLVELGYITNAKEAAYMSSAEGQEELATAIVSAITAFVKNS